MLVHQPELEEPLHQCLSQGGWERRREECGAKTPSFSYLVSPVIGWGLQEATWECGVCRASVMGWGLLC